MNKISIKNILAIIGIASFSFTAGMVPKCSEIQTVAAAKEQHSMLDENNRREHDKIFEEIKLQREQQQETLKEIIKILRTRKRK